MGERRERVKSDRLISFEFKLSELFMVLSLT